MTTDKELDTIEDENFILTGRISAEQYFGEGFTQLFFGFPVTKLLFHNVIQPGSAKRKEVRKAGQYLTMPTTVAIEFAHLLLTAAKQSEGELLKDLGEEEKEKIRNLLKDFKPEAILKRYVVNEVLPAAKKPVASTKKALPSTKSSSKKI